ncbi:sushi domain-containing protein 3 isoform X1 [Acipenser ruthenus]|uniref:sushi domain-containing protein 3 isoform X1 n=1 Tax=Acipenser ruthenus TaxID=7906 RepID=UPI0027418246|nr:sushi domain-containing protein 3 isoform X1 [Acipenser ruthenus]
MGLWHFLAWMVWGLVNPAFAFSMYEKPLSIRMPTAFDQGNTTVAVTTNISAPHCAALHPLHHGSFYVEAGSGTSLGSVLTFWCNEGYQLVGSEKVTCIVKEGAPQWSNYLPACEVIPKPVDRGLRVAVLVSVISGIVILSMSASFIACCVRERLQRARDRRRDSRHQKGSKSLRRRACWSEREEGEWERTPPKRLPSQLDYRLSAPKSPLYLGEFRGYENQGYQRSQENLLRVPSRGLYSEPQVYPHVVLQRVPTPTAPVYLHLPAQPADSHTQIMSSYTNPAYCSPQGTPQRHYQ